jgi:hypothetical protein
MKFSRRGMTTTKKIAVAIPLVLVIAAGVYVALGPGRLGIPPNASQSSSAQSSTGIASFSGVAGQPKGILSLFGNFSQMAVTTSYVVFADGEVQSSGTSHYSYAVLGRAVVNSTDYHKVEFTNSDARTSEIAWFNPQGLVDRVDVLGDRNYSGPNAQAYAQSFVGVFSFIQSLSYNATLISGLHKTAEGMQSVGPMQMDVITYGLAAPSAAFANVTAKIATVPGTSTKLAVYWYQQDPTTSNTSLEVTSAARA